MADQVASTPALEEQLAAALQENEELKRKVTAKRFDWRRFFAYVFLIAGLVILPAAELLVWANRTITDNQRYVATVGPIIHEASVQKAIVTSATTNLYSRVDIQQEVTQLLPDKAQVLAGPITGQVKSYINSTVAKIVASDQFAGLWVKVNQRAQARFMQVARSGNTSDVVDVNRLYSFISIQLAGTPLEAIAGKQLPPKVGQFQIVTIPALARIPQIVSTLSDLRWVFVGVSLGLLLVALVVARDRRGMAMRIGAGWMVVVVIGFVAVRITRSVLLGQITNSTYQAAAGDVWQALLTPLFWQSVILFVLGLALTIAAWLAGPAKRAVAWRVATISMMGSRRAGWWPQLDNSGLVRFIRRYHGVLLWTLLGLTILVLLLLVPLTIASLATVLVISFVVWLILEFLAAPIPSRSSG